MKYYNGLGGFAQTCEELDATTYEELVAFNYCLASDYMTAIFMEDFEDLGCINPLLLDDILKWYIAGGESIEFCDIEKIKKGLMITSKGRTLVDAAIDEKNDFLAVTFICNGNRDPRLYALCATLDCWSGLLNYRPGMKKDEYLAFLKSVFTFIDEDYGQTNGKEKAEMLSIIKNNILSIKSTKEIGTISADDIGEYQFIKDIRKIRGRVDE